MDVSVRLQDPYAYVIWPLLFAALLCILVGIIYYIILQVKKIKPNTVDVEKAWRALSGNEKYNLRVKYMNLLDELYGKVSRNEITIRQCYQTLSLYLRQFVSEITGIKVTRYTLNDIKYMNVPVLVALISEYYEVEFAEVSVGDAGSAISRTKKVIELWN